MGDIIKFRDARKQITRDRKEHQAQENRAKHGRTKAEKERDRKTSDQLASKLDGHKRTRDGDDRA
ncbi:MAG: DUF4169 family protein [Pseudomonadota bacterium]